MTPPRRPAPPCSSASGSPGATANALAETYALGYLALLAADAGDLDEAARTVPEAIERAEAPEVCEHFVAALPHLALAVLASASGRPRRAAVAAERSLDLAQRGAGRLELALALGLRVQTAENDRRHR